MPVSAPAAVALAAAKAVTPRDAPLAGLLFRLRGLPAARDVPIFRQMLAAGFVEVHESPTEIVLSADGQPWRLRGGRAGGGAVRMTLRISADGSYLRTETTVEPSDAAAERRFRRYWRVIAPFSGLVRRSWLRAAARRALA
ncbi:MAG TPA: hypothetical protein VF101_12155 [Gaiellaceae bacterium]